MNHYSQHVSQEAYEQHKQDFLPFLISNLDIGVFDDVRKLQQSDVVADVSCSQNDEFNGNPAHREQVNLKLADFIAAYQALCSNQNHWILNSSLNLYLSQCCLYATDASAIQVPYPEVLQYLPDCLQKETIDAVNVWINLQESKSSCHYDANHNLLMMIQGHKKVFLIRPSLTHLLKPVSCIAEAHNHSTLSCSEIEHIVSLHPSETHVVSICRGDALFIPEGWWHMVYSTPATYAVNVWYKSSLYSFVSVNNKMLPYIIRSAINTYVSEDAKQTLQANKTKFSGNNEQYCKADLTVLVNKAIGEEYKNEDARTLRYNPLISADLSSLESTWVPFVNEHPVAWMDYLRDITPEAAFRILEAWDALCSSMEVGDLFERLFAPCGDGVSEIRAHLITKKNEYAEHHGRLALSKIGLITTG